jgi:exodeoxyribonuclease V alpha subunit
MVDILGLKMTADQDNLVEIIGEVTRVNRFDSGYAIVTVKKGNTSVKLVGDMPGISEGMTIKALAEKTVHQKYGEQFKVRDIEENGFANIDSLIKYLSSNTFSGIGVSTARSIVQVFGMETFDILDNDPERLYDVPGLSDSKVDSIIQCWTENREFNRIIAELVKYGMTPMMAKKVYKSLGESALDMIRENIYTLTQVSGIGFLKADEIALKSGVKLDSPQRVDAAVLYVLDQALSSGHCYLPLPDVSEQSVGLLKGNVNATHVMESVRRLASSSQIVNENHKIFLSGIREAEKNVASMITDMLCYKGDAIYKDLAALRKDLKQIDVTKDIVLAEKQEEALFTALNSRVAIITGGPGVGKTTVTKALCALFERHNMDFLLCAPTGRAAKRLSEATGSEASTIHRLLKGDSTSQKFTYHQGNPLWADVVVIDESSMMDIRLFRSILFAMERHMRLIIVGDKDQLPSVGPGNVLRDLISSGKVPCVKLDQIFRQSKGNTIIPVAHDILHGVVPDLPTPIESKGRNCVLVVSEDQATLTDMIIKLVTQSLPKAGFKNEDIQILTPMRGRGLGVEDLNPPLQAALNPPSDKKPEIQDRNRIFRVGDRVMQIKNNYKKGDAGVFNGDIGYISSIINDEKDGTTIWVKYPDMESPVEYSREDWDEIMHCLACTVHKSQGAEYPCVILVQHPSQYNMLQRNLIYTGVTRAKKLCIIAGTKKALEIAVANDREISRNTTLSDLLKNLVDDTSRAS